MILPDIKNQFINDWLRLTGGTESPDLFNLWTGLSAIAACLGRRCALREDRFEIHPNMYVIITGPAAVRKSSAGSIASKILKKYTDIKFGPTDTGGQRQGLLTAFLDAYGTRPKSKEEQAAEAALSNVKTNVADEPVDPIKEAMAKLEAEQAKSSAHKRRKQNEAIDHDLFIFADEFTSLIGMNQVELITCLNALYYPQPYYEYSLAKSKVKINKPGLNILACTTPTALVKHLPEAAIGQGFSSRVIFVYEDTPKDKVFRPPPLDQTLCDKLGNHLANLSNWSCDFVRNPKALQLHENIYKSPDVVIPDTRFSEYSRRRDTHLIKLMMLLAAGRDSTVISGDDVLDAHLILMHTEKKMNLSLGELGMTKTAIAKQHIRDSIVNSWPEGLSFKFLKAQAMRDMTSREFEDTLNKLIAEGVCSRDGKVYDGNTIEYIIPALPEKMRKKVSKRKTRKELERELLTVSA